MTTPEGAELHILSSRELDVVISEIMPFTGLTLPKSLKAHDVRELAHSYKQSRTHLISVSNHMATLTCVGCGHAIGHDPTIWQCDDLRHLIFNEMTQLLVIQFGLTRCVRCSKLSERPWDEGVNESGHMTFGAGWFCFPCWHGVFEDRR